MPGKILGCSPHIRNPIQCQCQCVCALSFVASNTCSNQLTSESNQHIIHMLFLLINSNSTHVRTCLDLILKCGLQVKHLPCISKLNLRLLVTTKATLYPDTCTHAGQGTNWQSKSSIAQVSWQFRVLACSSPSHQLRV